MLDSNSKNEKRLARLCWNTNNWIFPSGRLGKSKNSKIHEGIYGYGHEEWLFDTSKSVDGYQYGFLEPVRKHHASYINKNFDVLLFTIDGVYKRRYIVGKINNLEVISKDEAEYIKSIYQENGWLKEMRTQIRDVEASSPGFSNWKGVDLFNVKFNQSDLYTDLFIDVTNDNNISRISRYTFAHIEEFINDGSENNEFVFQPANDSNDSTNKKKTTRYFRTPKAIEISHLHDQISIKLTNYLKKKYGSENVTPEHSAGYDRKRIDIVVKNGGNLVFYEIKTYPSLHSSIREAVGQLLEYNHWNQKNKAHKLIIVTQPHSRSKEAEKYLKHLRVEHEIPIYYQEFDLDKNVLSPINSI